MRIILKFLAFLAILGIVFIIFAYGFLKIKAKDILVDNLRKNINREVSIKEVNVGFPLTITINGLEIVDFLNVDKLSASINPLGLLAAKVVLNSVKVDNPSIIIERLENKSLNLPISPAKNQDKKTKKEPPFIILNLDVIGGKVSFYDRMLTDKEFVINIDDIEIHANKTSILPTDFKVDFNANAKIFGKTIDEFAVFGFNGWVDIFAKDMGAQLEITGLNCGLLVPYINLPYISLDGEKISKAKLNLNSNFAAKQNDLTVDSVVEIENLAKEQISQEIKEKADSLSDILLEALGSQTDKVVLDVTFKTKLDHPIIENLRVKTRIDENIIRKNLLDPFLNKDANKESLDNLKETFKGIGDKLKEQFKKPKENQE